MPMSDACVSIHLLEFFTPKLYTLDRIICPQMHQKEQ